MGGFPLRRPPPCGTHRRVIRASATAATALAVFCGRSVLAANQPFLDVSEWDIATLERNVATGLSCARVIESYLERIENYDREGPRINSYLRVAPDALDQARARDRESPSHRQSLFCVPVIVKDNIDVAGLPTTAGSPLLANAVASSDASVVRNLRAADAVIMGKANMDEWAHAGAPGGGYSSLAGQTRNPYDPRLAPSGSSGGSAAAVAANLAMLGIGTDTSGSIRAPAAANGIVTIKPTIAALSTEGILPFSATTDVPAPLARTVRDAARALQVMRGSARPDYTAQLTTSSLQNARIGIVRSFFGGMSAIDANAERAAAQMRARGAIIIDGLRIDPQLLAIQTEAYRRIAGPEFRDLLAAYLKSHASQARNLAQVIELSASPASRTMPGVLEYLRQELNPGMDDINYRIARVTVPRAFRKALDDLIVAYKLDALLFPTAPCTANPYLGSTALVDCRSPGPPNSYLLASLSGYPQIAIPSGLTALGMPTSVSLLGGAGTEGRLVSLAYAYEQASHERRAPMLQQLESEESRSAGDR